MRFGIWIVTEEGLFGTERYAKYYIEREQLALVINGEYVDMLVQIAQKTDVGNVHVEDLNEAYRYAIDLFEIEGITNALLDLTYIKQR